MRHTSIALAAVVVVMILPVIVAAQTAISIDNVTVLTDDSTLPGGLENAVVMRYNLTSAPPGNVYWPANAWIIYSPDGADWGFVQGEVLPAFSGLGWSSTFINHFNKTGGTGNFGLPQATGGGNASGHDTVGVMLAALFNEPGQGLPSGFNTIAFQIRFGPRRVDAGLHICIDTSLQVPGGSWEWASPAGEIVPDWGGGRCWVIGCCAGMVGDVDGEGGDEPTIGDISRLVDFLFISLTPPDCLEEADVDQSGTTTNPPLDLSDITIADISLLIDHLFISMAPLADCP